MHPGNLQVSAVKILLFFNRPGPSICSGRTGRRKFLSRRRTPAAALRCSTEPRSPKFGLLAGIKRGQNRLSVFDSGSLPASEHHLPSERSRFPAERSRIPPQSTRAFPGSCRAFPDTEPIPQNMRTFSRSYRAFPDTGFPWRTHVCSADLPDVLQITGIVPPYRTVYIREKPL